MIVGYAYTAMLITGIMHAVLGFIGSLIAIIGMSGTRYVGHVIRVYCGVALVCGLWILLIAGLGISAGIKQFTDDKIRKLKIAYMVTAILSACIFSLVGLSMFCCTFTVAYALNRDWSHYITIGHAGSVIMALEFVLAIVSSSICCCCSNSNPPTTVIIQTPAAQTTTAVQYQTPGYPSGVIITNP